VQAAQEEMKWVREDTSEIDMLSKLEGNGMKDKKIRELANKYKGLNIAYEKEKTMYAAPYPVANSLKTN
jgi:hypothetical protein